MGGPISKGQLERIVQRFPSIYFIQTYGQTECSPRVTALLPPDTVKKMGSVGKAIPGVKIKVVRENGSRCNYEEVGEILVSGNNIMKGYYKNQVATEEVIKAGWIHTGDLGYVDKEGFLYIKGRKKNIIISGGLNIYPEEVEEVIREISGVRNVCVKGIYNEEMGELPIAEVVKSKDELSEEEIITFCKKRMSHFKVPKKIMFVKHIEVTYNGKNVRT